MISSVGEVNRWTVAIEESGLCTCGEYLIECPFWNAASREYHSIPYRPRNTSLFDLDLSDERLIKTRPRAHWVGRPNPFRSILKEILLTIGIKSLWLFASQLSKGSKISKTVAHNCHLLFESVRRAENTPIVVDSSKNPGHMKALYLSSDVPVYILYLIRDGRATCCSIMKADGEPMHVCAKAWKMEFIKQKVSMASIKKASILTVRYEDLCKNPSKELRRICKWLGIFYEEQMLDFRKDKHVIWGNPMLYRKEENRIYLDEKWKKELSTADLRIFEAIAGSLNRNLGYK